MLPEIFDVEIQRAIYALPEFEGGCQDQGCVKHQRFPSNNVSRRTIWSFLKFEIQSPDEFEKCLLPRTMSKEMTARLIISKIESKHAEKCPLCMAIDDTANFLIKTFGHDDHTQKREYVEALARAASIYMRLSEISLNLAPTGIKQKSRIIDRALVAAVSLRRTSLAKELLDMGAFMPVDPFFGGPFVIAGHIGCREIALLLLSKKERCRTPNDVLWLDPRHMLLTAAFLSQNHELFRFLIESPAYENLRSMPDNNSLIGSIKDIFKSLL